jgi:hypothetical protein
MGDSKFSESLELMAFLANLVGIQHIQRFVPLADPAKTETSSSTTQTVEAPTVIRTAPHRVKPTGDDTTREMPRLKPASLAAKPAPAKQKVEEPKAASRTAPAAKPAPAASKAAPAKLPIGRLQRKYAKYCVLIAARSRKPPRAEYVTR